MKYIKREISDTGSHVPYFYWLRTIFTWTTSQMYFYTCSPASRCGRTSWVCHTNSYSPTPAEPPLPGWTSRPWSTLHDRHNSSVQVFDFLPARQSSSWWLPDSHHKTTWEPHSAACPPTWRLRLHSGPERCAAPLSASAGERAATEATLTHFSWLCPGNATGPVAQHFQEQWKMERNINEKQEMRDFTRLHCVCICLSVKKNALKGNNFTQWPPL